MPADNNLRRKTHKNLFGAAVNSGVKRYIVQSKGFYNNAKPGELADESSELLIDAPGAIGEACREMASYESDVIGTKSIEGVVLRYGFFYGPGTWYRPGGAIAEQAHKGENRYIGNGDAVWSFVHIDDAISATVSALTSPAGIYNIVDDNPLTIKEHLNLFASWVGAPEPEQVKLEDAVKTIGEEGIFYHTALHGSSNSLAKKELGFQPRRLLWLNK